MRINSAEILKDVNYGEVIASFRRDKGLSQRKLAELSGVTNSTISRIEANEVIPDLLTIDKISEALEMDVFELLAKVKGYNYSEELIRMNSIIKDFSIISQEIIYKKMEEYLYKIIETEGVLEEGVAQMERM